MTWKLELEPLRCVCCKTPIRAPYWQDESGDLVCSLDCSVKWDADAEDRAVDYWEIAEGYHEQ